MTTTTTLYTVKDGYHELTGGKTRYENPPRTLEQITDLVTSLIPKHPTDEKLFLVDRPNLWEKEDNSALYEFDMSIWDYADKTDNEKTRMIDRAEILEHLKLYAVQPAGKATA